MSTVLDPRMWRLAGYAGMVAVALLTGGLAADAPPPAGSLQVVEVERLSLPYGQPQDATVVGTTAYVANGVGGLLVVDLARGREPQLLGQLVTGNLGHHSQDREWIHEFRGAATAVSVAGRRAYLLTQGKGYDVGRTKVLQVNVADPRQPVLTGEYVLMGVADGLAALSETRVAVARRPGGEYPPNAAGVFSVLDFSEPGRVRILGTLPTPPGVSTSFQHVAAAGALAVVCGREKDGKGWLAVLDLADATSPRLLARLPTAGVGANVVLRPDGKVAYVADGAPGVTVVDLAQPAQPKIALTLALPAGPATALALADRSLLVLAGEQVVTLDLKAPLAPTIAGTRPCQSRPTALAVGRQTLALLDPGRGLLALPLADDRATPTLLPTVGTATRVRWLPSGPAVALGAGGFVSWPAAKLSGPPSGPFLASPEGAGVTDVVAWPRRPEVWAAAGAANVLEVVLPPGNPPAPGAARLGGGERAWCTVGSLAYAATAGVGLRIYDAANPAAPVLVGELKLPADDRLTPIAVAVENGLACLATGRDGLRTIDVSDPKHPVLVGRYYDYGCNRMSTSDVKLKGGVAYLADLDNGLYILDVKNPREPKLLAQRHTANAHTVDVAEDLALIADGVYGLRVFDVRDPAQPQLLARHHAVGVKFTAAIFAPDYAASAREAKAPRRGPFILAADGAALRVLKLVPTAAPLPVRPEPRLAAHVKLPMGIPDLVRLTADGKLACLVNDEGWNLVTVDLTDLRHPRLRSVAATSSFAHGLALRGNTAFACNNADACTFFDLKDPDHPVIVGAVFAPRCRKVAVLGDALFTNTNEGIACVDITDLAHPQIKAKYQTLDDDFTVWAPPGAAGKRWLLGTGPDGWQMVEVTDLAQPHRTGGLPGAGFGATAAQGEYAYVAQGKELLVVSLRNATPQIVGRVTVPGTLGRVSVSGRYVCFTGPALGLVDVGDPAHPALLGQVPAVVNEGTYGSGKGLFLDAQFFTRDGHDYVAAVDHYWGLRIYDAGDKQKLAEIGDFPTSGGDFTGIQASGQRVYVGNNWGGIYIVDVRDPLHPQVAGNTRRVTTPNKGCVGLLADGARLFFQGNTDRVLRLVDAANAAQPRLLGEFPLPAKGLTGDNRRFGSTFGQLRGNFFYTPGFARVFDVSNPATPQLVGECPEVGFQNDSCALADVAGRPYLVIGSEEGLKVVDVNDPRAPKLVGLAPGDHQGGYYFGRGLQVVGTTVYVTDRHQLDLVDLSRPQTPRRLGSLEVSGFTSDVKVLDGVAWVIGYYGGLHLIDVHDPAAPKPIDHFQQGVYPDQAAWDNIACYQCLDVIPGYAFVTEYYSGLHVIAF